MKQILGLSSFQILLTKYLSILRLELCFRCSIKDNYLVLGRIEIAYFFLFVQMLRSYFKKFDPDEPPTPGIDDDDELGSQRRHKKEYDPNSLEER